MQQAGHGLVELVLVNEGARRSTTMRLRDAVSGTRGASMWIGPLTSGERAVAAYQLPTARRGRMTVGPLEAELADPFGLSSRRVTVAEERELVVYPPIDTLLPVAHAAGSDPQAATRNPDNLAVSGDDFFALRPYAVGDDLRRVHWPTLARTGELVVRQHEQAWQERTTVLVDVAVERVSTTDLDRIVAAAASLLVASCAAGDQIRLCTSANTDSGFGAGPGHLDALLLRLALQQPEPDAALSPALDRVARGEAGGSLVVLAAAVGTAESGRLVALRGRFGQVVAVSFDPDGLVAAGADRAADAVRGAGSRSAAPPSGPAGVLRCPDGASFAAVWNDSAVTSAGPHRSGVRR